LLLLLHSKPIPLKIIEATRSNKNKCNDVLPEQWVEGPMTYTGLYEMVLEKHYFVLVCY